MTHLSRVLLYPNRTQSFCLKSIRNQTEPGRKKEFIRPNSDLDLIRTNPKRAKADTFQSELEIFNSEAKWTSFNRYLNAALKNSLKFYLYYQIYLFCIKMTYTYLLIFKRIIFSFEKYLRLSFKKSSRPVSNPKESKPKPKLTRNRNI